LNYSYLHKMSSNIDHQTLALPRENLLNTTQVACHHEESWADAPFFPSPCRNDSLGFLLCAVMIIWVAGSLTFCFHVLLLTLHTWLQTVLFFLCCLAYEYALNAWILPYFRGSTLTLLCCSLIKTYPKKKLISSTFKIFHHWSHLLYIVLLSFLH
jgi:hypothetical protein